MGDDGSDSDAGNALNQREARGQALKRSRGEGSGKADGRKSSGSADVSVSRRSLIVLDDDIDDDDDDCNDDYVVELPPTKRKRARQNPKGVLWSYLQEAEEDQARSAQQLGPKFAALDAQHVLDMSQLNALLDQSASMLNQAEPVVPQDCPEL